MNEQTNLKWLEEEAKSLKQPSNYEELPSLKLTPNVVAELSIDVSKPWDKWDGEDTKGKPITKKIIPVVLAGTKMYWWLNVRNPIYREIVELCASGTTKIKVLQTGTQANTKYVLVK